MMSFSLVMGVVGQERAVGQGSADVIYASYTGSQQGVTVRNLKLQQLAYFSTPFKPAGIAAGTHHDVYLASGNHLYHYRTNGTLITNMTFPDAGVNYTDISISGDTIYAAYTGSQQGVTVRNLKLQQLSCFSTPFTIAGITAGPHHDVYLASRNHLYHYRTNGTLITNMTFPDAGVNYTDVTINGDRVYASYTGSQQGVTIRDLELEQLACFSTPFKISGITAGTNHDVYLASGNHLYHYRTNGTLITNMTFPDAGVNYTDVTR